MQVKYADEELKKGMIDTREYTSSFSRISSFRRWTQIIYWHASKVCYRGRIAQNLWSIRHHTVSIL